MEKGEARFCHVTVVSIAACLCRLLHVHGNCVSIYPSPGYCWRCAQSKGHILTKNVIFCCPSS